MQCKVVPALLLGNGVTVLGTLRCLSMAGIPAYVLSSSAAFERYSRYYKSVLPTSSPQSGVQNDFNCSTPLSEILAELPLERAVLFPCNDAAVLQICELPEALAERFTSVVSARALNETIIDKARFAKSLEHHKVPMPVTHIVGSVEEVRALPWSEVSNWFLKPLDSQVFFSLFGRKAWSLGNADEAEELLSKAWAKGQQMLFQEYVPGPASNHFYVEGFFDSAAGGISTFARRRLRMYPPRFGNSSYMVSIALEEVSEAVENLHQYLAANHYCGIYSAEFKEDERDGQFRLLEINARPWWYIEVPARCGLNLAELNYNYALGQAREPDTTYTVGRRTCYPYYDYFAAKPLFGKGELSWLSWLFEVAAADYPVFRLNDPGPALGWAIGRAFSKIGSRKEK